MIHFSVARSEKGYIVTYGRGVTAKIAEGHCREHVETERKGDRVSRYEPYVMPKPKFRKHQKVRRVAHHGSPLTTPQKVERVLENANSPLTAGAFIRSTPMMGFREWVQETDYEAVT